MNDEAERFMALVARLEQKDARLTPLQAALLAAAGLGLAGDSRSFARLLGLAHALVLREIDALAARDLLCVVKRNERTMRTGFALGDGAAGYAALFRIG